MIVRERLTGQAPSGRRRRRSSTCGVPGSRSAPAPTSTSSARSIEDQRVVRPIGPSSAGSRSTWPIPTALDREDDDDDSPPTTSPRTMPPTSRTARVEESETGQTRWRWRHGRRELRSGDGRGGDGQPRRLRPARRLEDAGRRRSRGGIGKPPSSNRHRRPRRKRTRTTRRSTTKFDEVVRGRATLRARRNWSGCAPISTSSSANLSKRRGRASRIGCSAA